MQNILKTKRKVIYYHMSQFKYLYKEINLFSNYFNYDELFVDTIDDKNILYCALKM